MRAHLRLIGLPLAMAACLLSCELARAQMGGAGISRDQNQVTVTFSIPRTTYKLHESIPLRVELHNNGNSPVLVSKEFAGVNVKGDLSAVPIQVEVTPVDRAGHASGRQVVAVDSLPSSPACGALDIGRAFRSWVLLSEHEFHGAVLYLDYDSFEVLHKPGIYRFHVKLTAQNACPPATSGAVTNASLPYDVWTGSKTWESPWIRITK
jgi:hypothetical protein